MSQRYRLDEGKPRDGQNYGRNYFRRLDAAMARLGAPRLVWHQSQGTYRNSDHEDAA